MKNIINELKYLASSQFGRNTFFVYLTQVIGGAFGFTLNLVLIRKLNVDDYGLFSLYSSAAMLIAGLIHLSWVETYNRFGSIYVKESIFPSVKKFFFENTLKTVLIVGSLFFIFSGWISDQFYKRPSFHVYLQIAILNAVIMAFASYFSVDIQIKQLFKKYFYTQSAQYFFRLLIILGLLYFSFFSLATVVSVYVLVPLAFVVYYAFSIGIHQLQFWTPPHLSPELQSQSKNFRNWALISAFSNQLIGNIDLSVMAHFHPDQMLAQYGAAARLTLPLHMAMASIGMVLLPKIASTKDPDITRRQLKKLIKYLLPIGVILLALSFLLPPILSSWAGGDYAKSEKVILYFLFSSVIVFMTNPPSIFLIAWGHVRMAAILNVIQLVVDLILDLLWIPKWGALGAIQATCVVHLMGMCFAYFQLYRAMKGKLKPYSV